MEHSRPSSAAAPPAIAAPHLPAFAPQVVTRRAAWVRRRTTLLIALGLFVLSFFLSSYRLAETIDVNSDEATYAIESVALMQRGVTMWNGAPFFVHPPMFFLIEGVYFKLLGIGNSVEMHRLVDQPYEIGVPLLPPDAPLTSDNLFNAMIAGRYLAILYGSLITLIVFTLGSSFLGRRMGTMAALLFMIDPYIVRRNHYNMLEPLTALFGLAMLWLYWRGTTRWTAREQRRYMIAAGVCFGCAMLSKELALIYVPGLLVHALLFRRSTIRHVATLLGTGIGVYIVFPLWASLQGQSQLWWHTKTWLFERLTGAIQDTGITRPGKSLTDPAPMTIIDYWTSFALLGIAGILAGVFLYYYFRRGLRDRPAELLTAFVTGAYAFFVVVWKMGGVLNEQFFYLIMPVTVLFVIYVPLAWPHLRAVLAARQVASLLDWRRVLVGSGPPRLGEIARLVITSPGPEAAEPFPEPSGADMETDPDTLIRSSVAALEVGADSVAATAARRALWVANGPNRDLYTGWATWIIAVAQLHPGTVEAALPYLEHARLLALKTNQSGLAMAAYLAQQLAETVRRKQGRTFWPGLGPALSEERRALVQLARDSWPARPASAAQPALPARARVTPAAPVPVTDVPPLATLAARASAAPAESPPTSRSAAAAEPGDIARGAGLGPRRVAAAPWAPWARSAVAGLTGQHMGTRHLGFLAQLLVIVLLAIGIYDAVYWGWRYGTTVDNSYEAVEGYLAATLPPGTAVLGRDTLDLYLLPKNAVHIASFLADAGEPFVPAAIAEKGIPYAILNDQAAAEHYNGANEFYYNWVRQNGDQVYQFDGRRWSSYAYRIDYNRVTNTIYGAGSMALGKLAYASSYEDPKLYPATAAFDGKITTRWASGGRGTEWIYVDLGARRHISRVELTWETAYAQSYSLQVSDNGTDWVTFYSTDEGGGNGTGAPERVNTSVDGRYVRLLCTQPGTKWAYSLWEISIYP